MAYGLRLTAFHAPSFFASREEAGVVELREARREAIAEGRAEGRAELLLSLLAAKFRRVPPEVARGVRTASPEQIEVWAHRLLDAANIADVFAS